jgi:uncharacterized NAD(P)/FAD-binding protein YdhS
MVDGGADWRALIDAMRPRIAAYWQALTIEDRKRFLRHARPYWEPHRHRMAPQIANRVAALQEQNRFVIRPDRIVSVQTAGKSLRIAYASGQSETVDLLFNCAGPAPMASWNSPLLKQLLEDHLVEAEPLGLGVECDATGHVRDSLYVLGVLRKGLLWESTAVRELSVQAAELVETIRFSTSRQVSSG